MGIWYKRHILLIVSIILTSILLSSGVLYSVKILEGSQKSESSTSPELAILEKKERELEEKERQLRIDEERLIRLQKELKETLNRYTRIRDEAEKRCKAVQKKREDYFRHLIKVYEAMPPEDAAVRIEKMDKKIALKILTNMKGKIAGKILSFVDPGKAAKFSEGFITKE